MTDTGENIVVPDEMTMQELEALVIDTQGRFSWTFTTNDNFVECSWRDYYKTSGGNRTWVKVDGKNDHYKLLPRQKKVVRISTS